ncbi:MULTISPECIES: hypothetical protein [unclassified Moorena]|nr:MULTISPECIES: hypothetical protein [unclassified Moorena]NEO15491.1 hypothetical protein [Moorena sp. SIO3E8]NEP98482.1 hypothetical protein [Moorena sp. SIO3F7]NEQ82758.1 hypothetical protein [Moorena sp. SIO2I5]
MYLFVTYRLKVLPNKDFSLHVTPSAIRNNQMQARRGIGGIDARMWGASILKIDTTHTLKML